MQRLASAFASAIVWSALSCPCFVLGQAPTAEEVNRSHNLGLNLFRVPQSAAEQAMFKRLERARLLELLPEPYQDLARNNPRLLEQALDQVKKGEVPPSLKALQDELKKTSAGNGVPSKETGKDDEVPGKSSSNSKRAETASPAPASSQREKQKPRPESLPSARPITAPPPEPPPGTGEKITRISPSQQADAAAGASAFRAREPS